MNWWHHAACRGMDTELWFAPGRGYLAAVQVCSRCPVADECLADQMAYESGVTSYLYGIFGGLTAYQRRLGPAPGP